VSHKRNLIAIVSHQKKEIYMCTSAEFKIGIDAEADLRKKLSVQDNGRKNGRGLCDMIDSTFIILAEVEDVNEDNVKAKAQITKSHFHHSYKDSGYKVISRCNPLVI